MSKSSSRRASVILAFRMTPDESAQLRAVASSVGTGPTTFARNATFKAASLPAPEYAAKFPHPQKADLAKLLGLVGRMASNLNQLTRVANAAKTVPEKERRLLRVLFAELRALRQDILAGQA